MDSETPDEIGIEVIQDDLIVDKMYQCILDFQTVYRQKPSHLVLSPKAFLQLKVHLADKWAMRTLESRHTFHGVPIVVADTYKFISPGIPPELVAAYEWKQQQPKGEAGE